MSRPESFFTFENEYTRDSNQIVDIINAYMIKRPYDDKDSGTKRRRYEIATVTTRAQRSVPELTLSAPVTTHNWSVSDMRDMRDTRPQPTPPAGPDSVGFAMFRTEPVAAADGPGGVDSAFYELSAVDHCGDVFEFRELVGKLVLIVNVSFFARNARRQFEYLNYLHDRFSASGLVIIAFPCTQFAVHRKSITSETPNAHKRSVSLSDLNQRAQIQASLYSHNRSVSHTSTTTVQSNSAILSMEQLIAKYEIRFHVFAQVCVNGKNSSPVFEYLKNSRKAMGTSFVKWNFEKFLVSRTGEVMERFPWFKSIEQVSHKIEAELAQEHVEVPKLARKKSMFRFKNSNVVGFNEKMFE